MEEISIRIANKVEEILKAKVVNIVKFENVPNNSVYKVIVNNRSYIFKVYKQREWPEDGKLIFVNRKLVENQIGSAKILAFDRSDSFFHTGFLLEECLPGVTADQIVFDLEAGKEFYKKLAFLVSRLHRIPIENFGYIGSGSASHNSFIGFLNDKYDEISKTLINKKLFDKSYLWEIKKLIFEKLQLCEGLPSVLNHGDLSTKNVIVDQYGELSLIDWDDAMSYNWIADIARMTYGMKFQYNDEEYAIYKDTFMEHYSTIRSNVEFNDFENTFHVWIGLDHLNYFANKPQYEKTLAYFKETVVKLTESMT